MCSFVSVVVNEFVRGSKKPKPAITVFGQTESKKRKLFSLQEAGELFGRIYDVSVLRQGVSAVTHFWVFEPQGGLPKFTRFSFDSLPLTW